MRTREMITRPNRQATRLLEGESGAAWVEWVVVGLILILATYALFQAVGAEFGPSHQGALEGLKSILKAW